LLELFDSLLGFRGPGSFRRLQGFPLGFGDGQAFLQVSIGGLDFTDHVALTKKNY
jgi:hypothetical protein